MQHSEMILEYIKIRGLTIPEFACCCRVSPETIKRILKGNRPGPMVSKKIYIATKGEINLNIPYRSKYLYYHEKAKEILRNSTMVRD